MQKYVEINLSLDGLHYLQIKSGQNTLKHTSTPCRWYKTGASTLDFSTKLLHWPLVQTKKQVCMGVGMWKKSCCKALHHYAWLGVVMKCSCYNSNKTFQKHSLQGICWHQCSWHSAGKINGTRLTKMLHFQQRCCPFQWLFFFVLGLTCSRKYCPYTTTWMPAMNFAIYDCTYHQTYFEHLVWKWCIFFFALNCVLYFRRNGQIQVWGTVCRITFFSKNTYYKEL